ncbi:tape measure protein [Massilia horti]|uniref:Addiction module antidote protein n=1 Tax=Massilia horti TaxID=2562153 RepID=A0A4Y9TBB0_9BURK|nr:tape measure protein [Massilia horti]TFW36159.1 hypothetical protein E4O92_00190 [Massilia horti]
MSNEESAGGSDLDSLEGVAACLAQAFESGDADVIAAALKAVADSKGLAELAAAAGVPRAELKAALNSGELSLDVTLAIMRVIDLHMPPSSDGAAIS